MNERLKLASALEALTARINGQRVAMNSPQRVWIDRGLYIATKDVALLANVSTVYSGFEMPEAVEYQLYEETGSPARGSYKGLATIVGRGSEHYLIIGDLVRDATITEYRIDKDMTRESEKRLDDMIAGVKAALGTAAKPGRRQTSKGQDWLRAYDEAMAYRKRVTPK